jgi:autoinducer 2-degrading protein
MFAIFASIKIKPDKRKDFLSTITETASLSMRDELGCVRFDVFQDDSEKDRYLLYEVYTNEAAFQDHLATPHAQRAMEGSKDWAEAPFEVTRASSIFPTDPRSFDTLSAKDK